MFLTDKAYSLPIGEPQAGEPSYHSRKLPFQGIIQHDWEEAKVERFIRAMSFPPHEGAVFFPQKNDGEVAGQGGNEDSLRVVCDTLDDYKKALKNK